MSAYNGLRDALASVREQLASVQLQVEKLTAERENVSSQLWDEMNEREGWKHRALRAERILAALRLPSEAMLHEMTETWIATSWGENHWQAALRAAVAAAEKEVGARAWAPSGTTCPSPAVAAAEKEVAE